MRRCGCDTFDDFEVTILVHEVFHDAKSQKLKTSVKITAGRQTVSTDPSSTGIFQQPLALLVEQGTSVISIDMLDSGGKVAASLKWNPETDILVPAKKGNLPSEVMFNMKSRSKGTSNVKVKLTMGMGACDEETPLLQALEGVQMSNETGFQIRQCLAKAEPSAKDRSKMEILALSSRGVLDIFEGLGEAKPIFLGAIQPDGQKKWILGIWASEKDAGKKPPLRQIDILKIKSIQPDAARANVFAINYFDSDQIVQQLSLRRVDRPRDVWIEMLQLILKEVHAKRADKKEKKEMKKDKK